MAAHHPLSMSPRKALPSLLLCLVLLCSGSSAASTAISLPAPLDREGDIIERYWIWLKAELNAPASTPWPEITIEPLPKTVRMAFFFPTEETPWRATRIVLSSRSIDRAAGYDRLNVIGELAHEMVHYLMILSENGWDADAEIMTNLVHHHCDPEFQRLSSEIARFIWDTYHSSDSVRYIRQMVHKACWRDGHAISDLERP